MMVIGLLRVVLGVRLGVGEDILKEVGIELNVSDEGLGRIKGGVEVVERGIFEWFRDG